MAQFEKKVITEKKVVLPVVKEVKEKKVTVHPTPTPVVAPTPKVAGATPETPEVRFNVLPWLDDKVKLNALTSEEKKELESISLNDLNQKVVTASQTGAHTAMSDAAMAIMDHAVGTLTPFPGKPVK